MSAPLRWLAIALGCEVASAAAAVVHTPLTAAIGWTLGTVIPFVLIGLFTVADLRQRVNVWYTNSKLPPILISLVLVFGLVLMVVHSLTFANWFARL